MAGVDVRHVVRVQLGGREGDCSQNASIAQTVRDDSEWWRKWDKFTSGTRPATLMSIRVDTRPAGSTAYCRDLAAC